MSGQLLTVAEAARRLNVSTKTVYRLLEQKRLPAYRVGTTLLRIGEADLEEFLNSCREEGK